MLALSRHRGRQARWLLHLRHDISGIWQAAPQGVSRDSPAGVYYEAQNIEKAIVDSLKEGVTKAAASKGVEI